MKRLFHPGSVLSSLVLRKLLEDTTVPWKIKYLSEEVGCSIGMVSRIKTFLCEQQWAEMTGEGLRITDEEYCITCKRGTDYGRTLTKRILGGFPGADIFRLYAD